MKKSFIYVLVLLFALGCKSSKVAVKEMGPSQKDVDRVSAKIPNYTLTKLLKGKVLYEDNCGSCHKLYSPNSRTEEKWKAVVPPMVKKVNKSSVKLTPEDQDLIVSYLITMCESPNCP